MAALWSGQKPADMSGSTTNPSVHAQANTSIHTHTHTHARNMTKVETNQVTVFYLCLHIFFLSVIPYRAGLLFYACQVGWWCWRRLLTFRQAGHGEWNADDPHQVFNRYQRPQNGSDTDRFTFASMD